MDSATFYDEFVGRQLAAGVNERHHAILRWLRRFGLKPNHSVLEIGCGIGTVTGLLAQELRGGGCVVAVDLSRQSIAAARERLAGVSNVCLHAGDAIEMDLGGPFDVVVLPDVIEHIPLSIHGRLFARLSSWLGSDGFVLLHYPNPHHLEWLHKHDPTSLQIVDQPIHADRLLADAYPHGLYLAYLETYSIWIKEHDYVVAILRRKPVDMSVTHIKTVAPSVMRRVWRRARRLVATLGLSPHWRSGR